MYLCPTLLKHTIVNIKIFIRERRKDTEYVLFRLKDGRTIDIHLKSDIIVNSKVFNNKSGDVILPKSRIKDEETIKLIDLQKKISEVKSFVQDWYIEQPVKENLSSTDLALAYDKFKNPDKYCVIEDVQSLETVFSYLANFIEKAPNRKDKKTGRTLVYNNIQQYKATEKHLHAFAKLERKSDYNFSEINFDFYNRFVDYLQKPQQAKDSKGKLLFNEDRTPILTKQPFTQNSVGKHIKILKVMLNEAKNNDADTSKFYVYTEDVDNIYLNEAELKQLKDYDFAAVPHLERVRDWFLLLAWTGSRFSDLEKIDKANIKNGMITYRQKKTNTSVTIPLHPVVNEILQKYNYQMPEVISNQRFNEYIKEVCQAAKIDSLESFTRTVGGKLVTETMPKYDLCSSHTCRRSFCTNMYLRGLDTLMIRSISGHRTEKSFLKYIKVSQQQHAEMMAKKWSEIYK
jgi:site-specific recombinase XerD